METPARFTFSPDGNTKVFPIPVTMKGDNYVRIDINGVTINDRTKFDLVNNAVVLVDIADVPSGSQLDVLVVQTDEGIANLGTVNSIDTVATNIANINTVASNVTTVNTVATNITAVNNVSTNMASVTDAVNQANAAAASAAAALVSENAAAASESAADASETAAATSAAASATSASNSASSASAASASQTAAATSATNAANSATASAASASSSSVSATNAAGSATAAATSATNAATSATNAANSASAAAASQTAAATSATNAATSETNAATSATAAAASQVAAAASAASAANSYDLFDDRYLGSKTSDPTLDNDGNALVQGALYFNSTANEMRVYDGANWIAASSAGGASLLNYNYTATAGQTTFSGVDDNAATLSYTQQNLIVTLNGIVLEDGTDYTASNGTSIVLTTAAAAGDELNIVAFKSFTTADMVPASTGGTFSGNVTIDGAFTSRGIDDNATSTAVTLDASGNLLVGTASAYGAGLTVEQTGLTYIKRNNTGLVVNRTGTDGQIAAFEKDGTTVGSIASYSYDTLSIYSGDVGLAFGPGIDAIFPVGSAVNGRDNAIDLGRSTVRFDDIYATNGAIQTSDANEKQQIADLTAAEMDAAKAISKLFKTFKWNDSVAENGDDARIHTGVIAQEVEAAMTDAGLDAGRYAFFISSTWWEADGQTYETAEEAPEGAVERTRKGIRYPQLLSFIGAATEQRLASIEDRLTALEGN